MTDCALEKWGDKEDTRTCACDTLATFPSMTFQGEVGVKTARMHRCNGFLGRLACHLHHAWKASNAFISKCSCHPNSRCAIGGFLRATTRASLGFVGSGSEAEKFGLDGKRLLPPPLHGFLELGSNQVLVKILLRQKCPKTCQLCKKN